MPKVAQTAVIDSLFNTRLPKVDGVYIAASESIYENQEQTNNAFSEKWDKFDSQDDSWINTQLVWYLSLYGFLTEQDLRNFVLSKTVILDAGCGLGYKAAWFAQMNPDAIVVAIDYSNAIFLARKRYGNLPNMVFVKGDIANTPFNDAVFDFINCDQVLHHTEFPPKTLAEFKRISSKNAVLNTYVYNKKALPRELLDDYFRDYSKSLKKDDIWELSEQLSRLGKILSELHIEIEVPDIPLLGIKGGKQDLQRFIYWNFMKCFWNQEMGWDASVGVNFDWYSPSNAYRYSKAEFIKLIEDADFSIDYLHSEEACHSGRFLR